MPIKISAKKRVRVYARRKLENIAHTRAYKDAIKTFEKAISSNDKKAGEKLSRAMAMIDKTAKVNVIHKNKADRLKSRIMKLAAEKKITPVFAKETQSQNKKPTNKPESKPKTEKKIDKKPKPEKPKKSTKK
ncbi:30S ribosomal protein S20 [Patescibacteria group bacterium]